MPTTEIVSMPETVGELVKLLSKYPADHKLSVSIVEQFDNGSVWPTDSYRMSIANYEASEVVDITFANGHQLD